jgi:hypothetical protein
LLSLRAQQLVLPGIRRPIGKVPSRTVRWVKHQPKTFAAIEQSRGISIHSSEKRHRGEKVDNSNPCELGQVEAGTSSSEQFGEKDTYGQILGALDNIVKEKMSES